MGALSVLICGQLDTSTLILTARFGQEAEGVFEKPKKGRGIIARGAMIPVVGSNTEGQAD